jgi:DNA-directed RNA polymerase specialized sigma24 family protein
MNKEQLQEVKSMNWDLLYQKLQAFSLSLAKLYFKKRYRNLPKGYTYEDVVQKAIKRALDKDWGEIDSESFENYLFGAVKSIFWGLVISADNKKTKPLQHGFDGESENESINGDTKALTENDNDIHSDLDLKKTMTLIASEISQKRNASELIKVFECIKEGLEPRQISKKINLSLEKVTNCKRQLMRIVDNISKTYSDVKS